MEDMFYNATLSTENYDNLLNGWAELSLQSGVSFNAGNSMYSSQSAASRQKIINTFDWTITDGGEVGSISTIALFSAPDTFIPSETENAFLRVPEFYMLFSILLFVIIRMRLWKKKKQ
jgi:hypothetical protein